MKCAWKSCKNKARENPYKGHEPIYCSKKCKNKTVVDIYRKKRKQQLVGLMGGACQKCGYNKCITALQFHHLDPSMKDFRISGYTTNWEKLLKEAKKCILVCANCHAEIHYNMNNS